jgi:HEAT repeat protein
MLLPLLFCAATLSARGGQTTDRSVSTDAALLRVRALIASKEWLQAEQALNRIVDEKNAIENIDAALYWLAFSQKKQGKLQQAERALERLITHYPESTWVTDAREMRVEIAPLIGNGALIAAESMSDEDEIKVAALQSLFMADPARAAAIAADILKEGSKASPQLKQAALTLLGQMGGKQSTTALIEIARSHPDVNIRKKAISSMAWKSDEEVFNLLKELVNDSVSEIAEAAVYALAGAPSTTRREKTVEILAQAARSGKTLAARRQALSWLALNGGDEGLDQLMTVYRSSNDVEIKKSVIAALGSPYGVFLTTTYPSLLSAPSPVSILTGDSSPVVAQTYSNVVAAQLEAEVVNRAAAKNSQAAKRARSASILVRLYDEEKDPDLKGQIIDALGHHYSNKEALSKIIEIARNDPLPEMRKLAVSRLGNSRDPEALRLLEELLK